MMKRQDLDIVVPAEGIAVGRPRVGLIVPRSNTACEVDLTRLAGDRFAIHATRMRYAAGITPEDPDVFFLDALREPVVDLNLCGVALSALGCTTAAMACDQTGLHAAFAGVGKRAILVSEAIVEELRAVGGKRIALFSPYTPASNDGIVAFLSAHGFETVSATGLGLNVSAERFRVVSRLAPRFIEQLIGGMDLNGADCLFLSCSDMPTLDVIAPLEQRLGIPVLSTNLALYRCIARALSREVSAEA